MFYKSHKIYERKCLFLAIKVDLKSCPLHNLSRKKILIKNFVFGMLEEWSSSIKIGKRILWLTHESFFWKADVKSVIFIYHLHTFNKVRNLTPNDPKFVIWPRTQIFSSGNNSQVSLIIFSYRTLSLIKSVIY